MCTKLSGEAFIPAVSLENKSVDEANLEIILVHKNNVEE